MTRASSAIVATIAAAVAVLHGEPQAPQTFRTSTDVVHVDVSVRDGGRIVTGLRAEDFVLTDNGVTQRIESVEATAVPIDLTLVVDVSGDPRGPWAPRKPPSRIAADIEAQLAEIGRVLRPEDRVRLFAVDRSVQQIAPLAPVSAVAPLRPMDVDGLSALYDTLAAALLQPVEPARRHVVIAATKGRDTISSIDAQAVMAIARRSDALFHVVMLQTAVDNEEALNAFQCNPQSAPAGLAHTVQNSAQVMMGLCWPTRRFWVPYQRRLIGPLPEHRLLPDGQLVAGAADATGGGLHKAAGLSVPTLTSTFRKAFDDFRSSYVLRYTAQGVPRAGWHAIDVKVRGSKSYTVLARKGYGVEETVSATVPAVPPAAPRTLAGLTAAYETGRYGDVTVAVRSVEDPAHLIKDFEAAGNPWPARPRREAAFVLELAEPGVFSSRAAVREQAQELLERFTRLIRQPLEPDVFERYWHFAALTLLEGTIRPGVTQAFVDRALERFPNEPRFLLSRAITTDQRSRTVGTAATGAAAEDSPGAEAATVERHYRTAMAHTETTIEAQIRLAWFLHRTNRHAEALAYLTAAEEGPITDASLRYLRLLFLGHVLQALDRLDESEAAYRGALAVLPEAQSARVALMNALILRDDRAGAEALADQVQIETSHVIDPWWVYWQGQYRMHAHAMARVRELAQ